MDLLEELRVRRRNTELWMQQRARQLEQAADALEARGRGLTPGAVEAGQRVLAQTPAELKDLALAAATGRLPQHAARVVVAKAEPVMRRVVTEARTPAGRARLVDNAQQSARAAASGLVDEASLGAADPSLSFAEAVIDGGLDRVGARYQDNLDRRKAEDAYDAEHYGAARVAGQIAGVGTTIAATGGLGGVVTTAARTLAPRGFAHVARVVEAANKVDRLVPMKPQGLTALATGGGAATGVTGQAVSDLSRGRVSSAGDYVASAAGGALGGYGLRRGLGPVAASALEGGATAMVQDILGGRDVDPLEAARAARAAAVGGKAGDLTGKFGTQALSNKAKELLGERLTVAAAWGAGQGVPWGRPVQGFASLLPVLPYKKAPPSPGPQRRVALPGGGHTRADFVTNKAVALESKFGPFAKLTPRQLQAIGQLPVDRYSVYHWLPSDPGRMTSVPGSAIGGAFAEE